jgi:CheY-like chemotaxis protein
MKRNKMVDIRDKILIVDDLPDWRRTLSVLLSDAGYEVQVTESSVGALRLLEKNKFDLAVVDLRLDESNEDDEGGLELAAEIKQCWPDVKIVLITGSVTPEKLRRAFQSNITIGQRLIDDYLPKAETGKLVSTIQRMLAK